MALTKEQLKQNLIGWAENAGLLKGEEGSGENKTALRQALGWLHKIGTPMAAGAVSGGWGSIPASGISYEQMENFFRTKMPRFLKPGKYQGADNAEQVFAGGFTGNVGLPEGFASLLDPLSGQMTEGGSNMSEGLLEALAGQMSTQDNASMMAASGLPTDVLKLSSPNQSTQPQASVNDLLVAMGLQNPDGSFVGGQSSAGPGADIGIAGGSMLDFLQGGGGGMTSPFGYGGGGYEDSMLASRMGRGSPRMGRGREFGDSGKEQSFLHR